MASNNYFLALSLLTEIIRNKAAFVPLHVADMVRNAGSALGICICTGALEENNQIVLYLA